MNIETNLLKNEERAVFALRSLYEKYGYAQYKMSKFEEYDLYVRNKDFLVSDHIITFTDTNGKLMALKPDVTLSIIKNSKDNANHIQKVYYNENVYRVSKSTDSYREIMQTGLECIGEIDDYCIYEVLSLAAESLKVISDDFVLDISHMGIVSKLISGLELSIDDEKEFIKCLGEKNAHQISQICTMAGCDDETKNKIISLVTLYGNGREVLEKLKTLSLDECSTEIGQLEMLISLLEGAGFSEKIHIDFSVTNNLGYYNGIVFKGFVKGIFEEILSGGQYDKLMRKMNRKSRAIGFAVYADALERLGEAKREYDIDTIILYDENSDISMLNDAVKMMTSAGKSVMAQKQIPSKIKYRQLLKMNEKGVEIVENNA
ncbi:MAG: ATP phosphoribosyltransferase regulatory subunit [Clostridia bacterium]|nr:ATP phosphoribosyltransferase regulatory subunit [Clostridia bacterium]